jgi:ankyrin repeat protein
MKIYTGTGKDRREKIDASEIQFDDFKERINDQHLGFMDIAALSGWYKNDIDEVLVGYVAAGNYKELDGFINSYGQGAKKAKAYLRDLRFDGDCVATKAYHDCSGWSLLNVAAAKGQPEMVKFLVNDIGMNVDTICYGVSPTYCCFPSMHDGENNFSRERLNAAKAFMDNNANLSHQSKSSLSVINTACWINDKSLREAALVAITENMQENEQDCNISTSNGGNALHSLLGRPLDTFDNIESQVIILVNSGVKPHQETTLCRKPIDYLSEPNKVKFETLLNSASITLPETDRSR